MITRSTAEYIRSQGAQDEATVVFRIRWLAGVTNADRVLFEGRIYNIKQTAEIGRRAGLDLRCVELAGDSNV